MSDPIHLLSAAVPALGWALLDFVWQGILVGWVAALLFALLRHAKPQARYLAGCAALALCLALPVAGFVERLQEPASAGLALDTVRQWQALPAATPAAATLTLAATQVGTWRGALQDRLPLVIVLWASGAALLGARMLLGLLWVRRCRAAAATRGHAAWQACADRLAARLGLRRPVRVGLVEELDGPVTAGWWRPVVLLPAALASGMPPELLEALLAHELAHVRRHDYLVNLLQSAVEVLLFYHPTVWWLSSRVRAEREQVADDLAATALGEPRRLAVALSELDRFQLSPSNLAPAAHGGELMSRIKRLIRPTRDPIDWKLALPAAALPVLGLAAALAVLSARAETTPAAPAPATAATAARPAVHPAKAVKAVHHDRLFDQETPYAIVRSEDRTKGTSMNGDSSNWSEVEAAKRKVNGEFIWFKENGKTYVIQDAAMVQKANTIWAPVDELGKEMDGYGAQMNEHGKKMEALGEQMRTAAKGAEPSREEQHQFQRAMREQGEQVKALAMQVAKLSLAVADAQGKEREARQHELAAAQGQLESLSGQMQAQGDAFRAKFKALQNGHMEEIGARMEEAGKPMDALGKKMDALGQRIDAEAHRADRATRDLIRDAQARGLATAL
jgi:beta-lactamase regulating signal transducer with metallopeptidase domain